MTTITNLTKKPTPNILWLKIKNKILGKDYNLSTVLAEGARMKKLNKDYRHKNTIPNTLAFPFSKDSGEIFLNINNPPKDILFLFIHSLLHLKKEKHGEKMEKKEKMFYNLYCDEKQ